MKIGKPQSLIREEKLLPLRIIAGKLGIEGKDDMYKLRCLAQQICDTYDELYK